MDITQETISRGRTACLLSNLAYDAVNKDKANPRGTVCEDGFAFVGRYYPEGYAIIAFQGSDDPIDFALDAWALFESPRTGLPRIHKGFWRAYSKIRAKLIEFLETLPVGTRLYFAGHSLGAAMAVCAVVDLAKIYTIAGMYGFGCPNVGSDELVLYYRTLAVPTLLITHGRDYVAFIPTFGLPLVKHVFLDLKGRIVEKRIRAQPWNPFRWKAGAKDHSCDLYLVCMDKLENAFSL